MTNEIDLIHTNKTILEILSKFPPIQNREKFLYHKQGKSFFYGLKSSDFNKFEFENGDRIFNHWRDKLVEMRLLIKIYPNKKRGSPYAITPFGIAYLIQNSYMNNTEIQNCINVVMHYFKGDKTGLKFDKLGDYIFVFEHSCELFKFDKTHIVIQTKLMPDIRLDALFMSSSPDPQNDKKNFEDSAYYLIGNMCWIIEANHIYRMAETKYMEESKLSQKKDIVELMEDYYSLSKEIKIFGKLFGQEIVFKLLDSYHSFVKNTLSLSTAMNK